MGRGEAETHFWKVNEGYILGISSQSVILTYIAWCSISINFQVVLSFDDRVISWLLGTISRFLVLVLMVVVIVWWEQYQNSLDTGIVPFHNLPRSKIIITTTSALLRINDNCVYAPGGPQKKPTFQTLVARKKLILNTLTNPDWLEIPFGVTEGDFNARFVQLMERCPGWL